MKILHVIANLGLGGAEGVLFRLIAASPPSLGHVVVSLMGDAHFGPRLREAGVPVHTLDQSRGMMTPLAFLRLCRLVAITRPDVVQTWMYHADLVGGLAARLAGVRPVVWGIRNSNLAPGQSSLSARVAARICAWTSGRIPAAIACCSEQAAAAHRQIGYSAQKIVLIPNGYDLQRFAPDPEARRCVRAEWGIQPREPVLGIVARWDPLKDHGTLFSALDRIKDDGVAFRLVLVGAGMDRENESLVALLAGHGLADRSILAGARDDIPAVMNALDLHVLSSSGEAFPNAVAEAMACGTPCVVTDVGDSALIVGDTGWVVPPRDPAALATGIRAALRSAACDDPGARARQCRSRIEAHFGLDRMVDAYVRLWERVR